jgi:hypothetical protein
LATSTILQQIIGLGGCFDRTALDGPLSDDLRLVNIHTYNQTGIVEEIAMAAKGSIHDGANLG